MNNLVKGSLGAIAAQTGQSLATTFLSCDVICIVDTSGSMGARDSVGGNSRYDQACYELATLQGSMPGKIGVISFSDSTMFCANGVPLYLGGTTDLKRALKFAKVADVPGSMRFICISDGMPDDPEGAVGVAKTYHNRIDVIYCGPEANPVGRDLLDRLAKVSGGQTITADRAKELANSVHKLLMA